MVFEQMYQRAQPLLYGIVSKIRKSPPQITEEIRDAVTSEFERGETRYLPKTYRDKETRELHQRHLRDIRVLKALDDLIKSKKVQD